MFFFEIKFLHDAFLHENLFVLLIFVFAPPPYRENAETQWRHFRSTL
jgi:hypothetical protein